MLRAQYLKNSWRCYLATIANYYIVGCEAAGLAILATAWFLVWTWWHNLSYRQWASSTGHAKKV